MTPYRHRQAGTVTRLALGFGALLAIALGFMIGRASLAALVVVGVVAVVLVGCLVLFGSLTVEVTAEHLTLAFGPGLIRKRVAIAEVRDARAVRNRWYWGFGIRLTPHGWLYNVSGLDAVEVDLASGRRLRIGTDEPERLLAAVREAMAR